MTCYPTFDPALDPDVLRALDYVRHARPAVHPILRDLDVLRLVVVAVGERLDLLREVARLGALVALRALEDLHPLRDLGRAHGGPLAVQFEVPV